MAPSIKISLDKGRSENYTIVHATQAMFHACRVSRITVSHPGETAISMGTSPDFYVAYLPTCLEAGKTLCFWQVGNLPHVSYFRPVLSRRNDVVDGSSRIDMQKPKFDDEKPIDKKFNALSAKIIHSLIFRQCRILFRSRLPRLSSRKSEPLLRKRANAI
jgi:hypothetical protein